LRLGINSWKAKSPKESPSKGAADELETGGLRVPLFYKLGEDVGFGNYLYYTSYVLHLCLLLNVGMQFPNDKGMAPF
jgi:hypothetical protein